MRLQDGFHSGGLRRGTSGPGGRGPISALEPPLAGWAAAAGICTGPVWERRGRGRVGGGRPPRCTWGPAVIITRQY